MYGTEAAGSLGDSSQSCWTSAWIHAVGRAPFPAIDLTNGGCEHGLKTITPSSSCQSQPGVHSASLSVPCLHTHLSTARKQQGMRTLNVVLSPSFSNISLGKGMTLLEPLLTKLLVFSLVFRLVTLGREVRPTPGSTMRPGQPFAEPKLALETRTPVSAR